MSYQQRIKRLYPYTPATKSFNTITMEQTKKCKQDQEIKDTQSSEQTQANECNSEQHTMQKMMSLYYPIHGHPKFEKISFPVYLNSYIQVDASSGAGVNSVSLDIQPKLSDGDERMWFEFASVVQTHRGIRYVGHKCTFVVNNPYFSDYTTKTVVNPDGMSTTGDFEFLKTCECHLSDNTIVVSVVDNPDWFFQTGVHHTKVGKPISRRCHVNKKMGKGNAWLPREQLFTNAELTSTTPPAKDILNYAVNQTGLTATELQRSIPFTYHLAVTGWPSIDMTGETAVVETKVVGFNVSTYLTMFFELKSHI
ncbi:MAG: hypothetical protein [Cressdnaviricota sp.]|nr:MAG: hypothetical protein [Cressdnaviricota sp.]